MNKKELFIALMIGIGSPFMAFVMGTVDQEILGGIGLLCIVILHVAFSRKFFEGYVLEYGFFITCIAYSFVMSAASFLLGYYDSLPLISRVLIMLVLTILNLSLPLRILKMKLRVRFAVMKED